LYRVPDQLAGGTSECPAQQCQALHRGAAAILSCWIITLTLWMAYSSSPTRFASQAFPNLYLESSARYMGGLRVNRGNYCYTWLASIILAMVAKSKGYFAFAG
jgi:hypothetical protein